jgi:hypothetical protein
MPNPFEQLKQLELTANFTPLERQYFYKLRDELEAIVGGVSIEKLNKPTDVVRARKIRAKLEEILKFVQDREQDIGNRERFMTWVEVSTQKAKFTDEWIARNIEFSGRNIICLTDLDGFSWELKYLPDNLYVKGKLDLENCDAFRLLPNNLQVAHDLNLNNCAELETLPDGLYVGGDLNLRYCTALKTVPDDLQVKGDVYIDSPFAPLSPEVVKKLYELKACGQIIGEIYE